MQRNINQYNYISNVIESGDLETIKGLDGSQLLTERQQERVTRILQHVGYKLNPQIEAEHFMTKTYEFILKALVALGFVAILSALLGCDKSQIVNIERDPDVYNVTYLTEEYFVTNVTEEYITQEFVTINQGSNVEIVTLCPDLPGDFPEVLFKVDNTFVALFIENNGGKNPRLAVLKENTLLQSTDGRQCRFRIIDGGIVYE